MHLAGSIPLVQVAQLHAQHSGLQLIHTGIDPQDFMAVAYARAVIAHYAHLLRQRGIAGDTDACFSIRTQVLAVIEAKTADIAYAANPLPPVRRPMSLRSILDYPQAMRAGKSQNGPHVGRMAVEMDGDDRASLRRQSPFELSPVH